MITLKPYQIRKGNLLPRVATALLLMLSAATASSQAPIITIGGNIYGGGNKGNVEILDGDILGNVFGGARRANVLETKVTVRGGKVRNVYGGNDISGDVEQQTYVDIRSNIINNVYGGGNGSYVYTDQEALKDDEAWEALYYAPGENSVEALNAFRPNVPRATIHLQGTSAPDKREGRTFCPLSQRKLPARKTFHRSVRPEPPGSSMVPACERQKAWDYRENPSAGIDCRASEPSPAPGAAQPLPLGKQADFQGWIRQLRWPSLWCGLALQWQGSPGPTVPEPCAGIRR